MIGVDIVYDGDKHIVTYIPHKQIPPRQWSPSKFWSQGGPLLEKMKIDLNWEWEQENTWTASIEPDIKANGESMLVAAMRAIVATKY